MSFLNCFIPLNYLISFNEYFFMLTILFIVLSVFDVFRLRDTDDTVSDGHN